MLTLALGIGATTALFTVVNAVLLEPLPFPDSNKLVQVWRSELPALTYGSASYARYLDWRQHQRVFTDLGAWSPRGLTIAGPQGPERAPGAMASASFFRVIGASPVVGRYFSDDEDRRGGDRVVVISEGLWRRRFQQSSSVLGTPLQIDGEALHDRLASRPRDSPKCGGSTSGFRSVSSPIPATAAATTCSRLGDCETASRSNRHGAALAIWPRR